jgi:hypothetical protein
MDYFIIKYDKKVKIQYKYNVIRYNYLQDTKQLQEITRSG